MCTLGFEGKGYTARFVENYQNIVDVLNKNPDTPIQVTYQLDDICSVCIHQRPQNLCDKQALIEKLDRAYSTLLELKDKQVITWQAAKDLIQKKVSLAAFHASCEGCSWKELGVCENALKQLAV